MKHAASISFAAIALLVGLALVPAVSSAQPAPAPTPVALATPDFSSMMFTQGTWNCTQPLRGKSRPDTFTNSIGMGGMWMVSQDTAPPFDQYRTVTINTTTYTGYDPTIKMWVQVGVGSDGSYYMASAPGWQGNSVTWTSKGLDNSTTTDVFTKVSDMETTDDVTTVDSTGKSTTVKIACKKAM